MVDMFKVGENSFDVTGHPLDQIDRDTDTTWKELTEVEQQWLFKSMMGRDPLSGEIKNQVDLGKSIKFFIHGVNQKDGELALRAEKGEEGAAKMLEFVGGWEDANEKNFFDSVADFTGIKELKNPYDAIWKVSGADFIFDDVLDIKEGKEVWDIAAPIAATIAATVFSGGNPAAGAAVAAANAGVTGDLGDMAEAGAITYVSGKLPTNELRATFDTSVALYQGDDLEDALVKGAISYGAGTIGDKYGNISPIVSNQALIRASADYLMNEDAQSAFTILAVDAGARQAFKIKHGEAIPDKTSKDSFKEMAKADHAKSMAEIQAAVGKAKQVPSNAVDLIKEHIFRQEPNEELSENENNQSIVQAVNRGVI